VLKGTEPHERQPGDELSQETRKSNQRTEIIAGRRGGRFAGRISRQADPALKRTPLATDGAGKPQTRFAAQASGPVAYAAHATEANKVARPEAMSVAGSESQERAAV